MAKLGEVVATLLEQQFPDASVEQLTIASIPCQMLPKRVQGLLQNYWRLSVLALTRCDLRTLENFPRIASL